MKLKQIETGTEPANRLLNVIVARGIAIARCQRETWLTGDMRMFMNFRFLAFHSRITATNVPTVLAYLDTAGFVKADFDTNPKHGAYINLRLPDEAVIA